MIKVNIAASRANDLSDVDDRVLHAQGRTVNFEIRIPTNDNDYNEIIQIIVDNEKYNIYKEDLLPVIPLLT
jgi:hypothetical protein